MFLREKNKVCTNWEFAFWQTATTLGRKVLQFVSIGGIPLKTMRILCFNISTAFRQQIRKLTFGEFDMKPCFSGEKLYLVQQVTTGSCVVNSMKWRLLTSTVHILCTLQSSKKVRFFIWNSFWLTVETKTNRTNILNIRDKLSFYQGNLFHFSKFCRPPFAWSRKLFHFIDFLRHTVWGCYSTWLLFSNTLPPKKGIVPLHMFTQTSCLITWRNFSLTHSPF